MKLSKTGETTRYDYGKILEEIYNLVPELSKKLDKIKDKYKTISKLTPRLGKALIKNEGINSFLNTILTILGQFKNYIMNWGSNYDNRLSKIKSEIIWKIRIKTNY